MQRKIICLIIVFFNVVFSYGQKNESIQKLIDNYDKTLFSNIDSSYFYIGKAVEESKKQNNLFLLSTSLSKLGYCNYKKQHNTDALKINNQAIYYAKISKNFDALASAYINLGLIKRDESDYNKALNYFHQSLDVAENNKLLRSKCNSLMNLGILYELQKDTLKALEYYKKNETIALNNGFKDNLMDNYICLAILNRKKDENQTIQNYTKAYALASELNNKFKQFSILVNLSDVYLLRNDKEKNQKALQCLLKAKKIATLLNETNYLFYVYFNLGGYYLKVKKPQEAIDSYQNAFKISKNGIDKEQLINIYGSLAEGYKMNNEYQKAYQYLEKHYKLQDSVFSKEKNKAFNEIQTKYEVEKKNLKIDILSKQKLIEENKRRLMLFVALGLSVLLISVFLFFKQRIKNQKLISEKENMMLQNETERLKQEQEIKWIKGVVEGQDQERNRVAQEIHDGVGGALAGIKLELSQLNTEFKNPKIEKIVTEMGKAFHDIRAISHNLSSSYLKGKDLQLLLNELKKEYENRSEFQLDLVIFPDDSLKQLSEMIKHQVYRIIQELLANVAKHAKAKNVYLNFTMHHNHLNIILEDDGIGFDSSKEKGIGLNNISERLSAINSIMSIESVLQKGTTILIDIQI